MSAAGYAEDLPVLGVEAEDTVAGGASGAALLASRGATALVCSSDSLALGAMEKLREAQPGAFLPGQPAGPDGRAAIVGFDDTPVAAALGLSSVAQPVEAAARHIIRVLTHELAGGAPTPPHRRRGNCSWPRAWWNGFRCRWRPPVPASRPTPPAIDLSSSVP